MSEQSGELAGYDQVKQRLDEIADQVSNEELPLEEALSLYEEAVKLGLSASQLIEEDTLATQSAAEDAEDGVVSQA